MKKGFGESSYLVLASLWKIPTVLSADASFWGGRHRTEPLSTFAVLPSLLSAINVGRLSSRISCVVLFLPFFTHFLGVYQDTVNTTNNNYCRTAELLGEFITHRAKCLKSVRV